MQQFSHMKLSYLPLVRKVVLIFLGYEYFTIPYNPDTIPNLPAIHQLPAQATRNVGIIAINGEEPITSQGELDELNRHKTPRENSKVNISLCRRKNYQTTFATYLIKSYI